MTRVACWGNFSAIRARALSRRTRKASCLTLWSRGAVQECAACARCLIFSWVLHDTIHDANARHAVCPSTAGTPHFLGDLHPLFLRVIFIQPTNSLDPWLVAIRYIASRLSSTRSGLIRVWEGQRLVVGWAEVRVNVGLAQNLMARLTRKRKEVDQIACRAPGPDVQYAHCCCK